MTREQRAKQFMPFDAMKGLQEALRDREERHTRTERHDVGEEQAEKNSAALRALKKGDEVELEYYRACHDARRCGTVTEINAAFKYLKLDGERIMFEDVYAIKAVMPP